MPKEKEDSLKWTIGIVTAVFGAIAALIGIFIKVNENRKARVEADIAEKRLEKELAASRPVVTQPQPRPQPQPGSGTPTISNPPPAPSGGSKLIPATFTPPKPGTGHGFVVRVTSCVLVGDELTCTFTVTNATQERATVYTSGNGGITATLSTGKVLSTGELAVTLGGQRGSALFSNGIPTVPDVPVEGVAVFTGVPESATALALLDVRVGGSIGGPGGDFKRVSVKNVPIQRRVFE